MEAVVVTNSRIVSENGKFVFTTDSFDLLGTVIYIIDSGHLEW